MAAGTKTFTTQFLIGSRFTGQKGFDQANKALSRTQKNAQAVTRGIGVAGGGFVKLAGAIGVATLAYKALGKATEFWAEGWKASEDAVKVQEALGVAAERNAKRYKMSGAAIEKSVAAVSAKVAAVGFDSEDATAGTTKLLESMSPKQIEGFGQAYADLTAKLKGATPGAEGFADVSEQVNTAILKGKAPWLAQLGYTDKQLAAFKDLTPVQRRLALQQVIQNRLQGEAERVFGTTAGKIAKAAKAYEDLGQALTGPAVARQGELAESQERFYKSLQPMAEEIGEKIAPAFERWAKILEDHGPEISRMLGNITDTILRAPDVGVWLKGLTDKIPVLFDLPAHWPKIKAFFTDLWANTEKEFNALWPIISKFGTDLWANTLKEWEQLTKIVAWIDTNIIQPIYNLFTWLAQKITEAWQSIMPAWNALTNQQANAAPGTAGEAARRATEGRTIQQQGKGYAPYTQRGTGTPAGPPSASLQEARARYAEELAANPALQEKLARLTAAEVGGQGEEAQQAFMETAVNRAASRNQTLAQTLQPNYYEPLRRGGGLRGLSAAEQERYSGMTKAVLAGSNRSDYATGNWSGPAGQGLGGRGGYVTKKIRGEQFSVQAADVKWAEQQKAAASPSLSSLSRGMRPVSGTGSPTNVTQGSTVININGVEPGREKLIATAVAHKLRDRDGEFLTQMKSARKAENRLNYV